ncbi:MAG: MarR family transcriptional regulator [Planctomycetaceae bacterium]|nr:MarR family transcriptional regulator [Planctomycetaceae bacterium]
MKSELRIIITIKKLVNQFSRYFVEIKSKIKDFEQITGIQGCVIGFVFEQSENGNVYQKDIEKELGIRRSSATTLLQRMEKNGLIRREPLPTDARWKKIVLTPKAKEFSAEVHSGMELVEQRAVRGLTDQQIKSFFEIVEIMTRNLA